MSAWAEAGQDEARFWDQTPATFSAVMDGIGKRTRREAERAFAMAWYAGAFSQVKLKPLEHYLKKMRGPKAGRMSETEMIFNLRKLDMLMRIGDLPRGQ